MSTLLLNLLLMGALWFPAQAQVNSSSKSNNSVFNTVEEPPQFPGGMSELTKYLQKNMHYPKAARKAKLEGLVVVNFIVTEEGHIKDVKLYNSLGLGTDEEAIRLVESMPDWLPGRQGGKAVSVRQNVPVDFKLK